MRNKNDLNEYYLHRPLMRTGDILQWRSASVLGWLIRKFSKAAVNHTSLIITLDVYDADRLFTTEALGDGIELNIVSTRLEKYQGEVWWMPLKSEYQMHRHLIGQEALRTLGTPYDYGALISQAVTRVKANPKKQFCSEHAFIMSKLAGIPKLQKIDIAPRPGDMGLLGIYERSVKIF